MAGIVIEIKGIKSAQRALGTIAGGAYLKGVFRAGAVMMHHDIARYPESTAANLPKSWSSDGPNSWYQRGYGPKWVRKDGSVGGRKTSQTLGRSWTTSSGKTWAAVGTRASYARYVQGADTQARFHKARGWRTDRQTLDKVSERVIKMIDTVIGRIWNTL